MAGFEKPGYPTFAGIGAIRVTGSGAPFAGSIMLAIDGDRVRLEIIDKLGRPALALAGRPGAMKRLDPATGSVERVKKDGAALFGGISIPPGLLRVMVTGEAPRFSKITSTAASGEGRMARTDGPPMKIHYASSITRLELPGPAGAWMDIALGPMARGQAAPYVSYAKLSCRGVNISVEWKRVKQGLAFAEGFFSFTDSL